jgi:predicted HTH transcriptional regulator
MDLVEGFDFEAKRATGRNGQGQLPESFFPSYSAMANTEGGVVLLGVDEVGDDKFEVVGIPNTTKVLGELWSGLNNRQKVNCNLLSENDVEVITVEGKSVIRVTIPRALRFQMPVCVGRNPFDGTYRRQGQGDFRCDEETVKRMLGEQIEDARDAQLLERFTIADLHAPTIRAYRAWRTSNSPSAWTVVRSGNHRTA